ncbi:hypothetical protein ABID81_002966 [Frigoribacterium sp. PvP054]|uniref:hypothetical protein n=1 Tax=Frigoribacterium sp. PvP054 TaxID=3156438 RepID=UPI0033944A48
MSDKTTRQQLADALKPALPAAWVLVPYSRNLDVLSKVTVMLHASRIERAPAAPMGALVSQFTITVIDPQDDPTRAWGALDDEVMELIFALDELGVQWTAAEPVLVQNNLGWEITIDIVSRKETP